MYFVNKNIKSQDVKDWLIELEAQSQRREKYLKVYLVYGNGENHSPQNLKNILANIGRELDLKKVALTFVPSFNDSQSGINLTKINPQAQNTFIIYKNRNIIGKFINLYAGQKNFTNLNKFIDDNYSQYFNLPIDTTSLSENRNCCEKHTI